MEGLCHDISLKPETQKLLILLLIIVYLRKWQYFSENGVKYGNLVYDMITQVVSHNEDYIWLCGLRQRPHHCVDCAQKHKPQYIGLHCK